ncbi:curved DNA-binding protein CbpA [Pedobacter sp. UYP30]|uniref:KTSC domain-containing protein n=1 Tax=Pedobacter sp. UYP30 TaxID=1756400 RepID=UPI0033959D36
MKRIIESRKFLGVDKTASLKELKSEYRNLMKEWHPDKFADNEAGREDAEGKSKQIIEAYHFLVSVAPETIEQNLVQYNETVANSQILNYSYEKSLLQLNFVDGSSYEYFGVPKNVYNKFCNADAPARFCRRNIYNEFVYRKVSKAVEA